jgi:hypothetical protein
MKDVNRVVWFYVDHTTISRSDLGWIHTETGSASSRRLWLACLKALKVGRAFLRPHTAKIGMFVIEVRSKREYEIHRSLSREERKKGFSDVEVERLSAL